jgi:ribosomal protein S27AE
MKPRTTLVSSPHPVADETAAGVLRTRYDSLPVTRPARVFCPRCGSDRIADYGAQVGCGHCGATWQAEAPVAELSPHSVRHGAAAAQRDRAVVNRPSLGFLLLDLALVVGLATLGALLFA